MFIVTKTKDVKICQCFKMLKMLLSKNGYKIQETVFHYHHQVILIGMDFLDSFALFIPIGHRSWPVVNAEFRVCPELMNVNFCRSPTQHSPMDSHTWIHWCVYMWESKREHYL